MLNPIVIRALVYAGLSSNALAISVCLMFGEWVSLEWKCVDFFIWVTAYYLHKKRGTWK
jgi:hypothetical protein